PYGTYSSHIRHLLDLRSFPTRRSSDLYYPQARFLKIRNDTLFLNPDWTREYAKLKSLTSNDLSYIPYSLNVNQYGNEKFENAFRSEEHTSELQSRENLVCRLLLAKKKS